MKLKNIVLTTMLVMGAAFTVNAGTNAQITITGDVVAATCDVSLSANSLDLGNYTPNQFTAVATPVAASVKPFTVGLSNCLAPLAAGDSAKLVVTGQTLGGSPNIFNTTGTTTGVMLKVLGNGGSNYLKNNDKLTVATAGTTPAVADFNGKVISLEAGLASATAQAQIGHVSAPIMFSFAYN
ncbi:fimbrial protein [Pragia fontium]|uniref:Major type 1 subunit fimbrin (Pilin) n=2 Tax=Pragia fontium TaxID=82985 RepID=A0AAJ4WDE7_9GAMM|nr:type 1 fimbrial protein [Pragia fontium]SFD41254.1 major type 1 subunit fimbrin (pilin) [Pragia fontium DSM 5563 = ATCC 49100]SUB82577.1 fimbrial protein BcfE [Pragia fontium]VEJ55477.1 fimbrial protein BcfE [Pragia fontium]